MKYMTIVLIVTAVVFIMGLNSIENKNLKRQPVPNTPTDLRAKIVTERVK